MGRIKTKLAKRWTLELLRDHKDLFKPSFDENKAVLNNLLNMESKKIRNMIAGYLTRKVRKGQLEL